MGMKWPWCQIPFHSYEVWKDQPAPTNIAGESKLVDYLSEYEISSVSYNPTLYVNLYRKSPLLPMISTQCVALFQPVFYEEPIRMFPSYLLTRDFSNDDKLCESFKNDKGFFDYLHPFKEYLVKLERSLVRGFLLDECWGINKELVTDMWSSYVSYCQSVSKLAKYAVYLIDATHCRAFHEEWNRSPTHAKRNEHKSNKYEDLSPDWTPEEAIRRRRWERTSTVGTLRLMLKEGI